MKEIIGIQSEEQDDDELTPLLKTLKEQEQKREAQDKVERFDWSVHRDDEQENWQEFIDGYTMPEKVKSLLDKSVLLPRHQFQSKIVASYLMLPSALCKLLPILYSHGPSGTGKSYIGKIAYSLHNTSPIGANSTATSIRNYINASRKFNPSEPCSRKGNERLSAVMVWEDISPQEMARNEGMVFNLMKLGIDRKGQISRANMEGGNDVFEVFSPKYISSVSFIAAVPEFNELIRRIIVVEHKHINYWGVEDYDDYSRNFDTADFIALDELDFSGSKLEFDEFWMQPKTLETWKMWQSKIRAKRGHGIPSTLWQISKDLLTCGLTCGYWESLSEAVEHIKQYWAWHEENVSTNSSANIRLIKRYIEEQTAALVETNKEAMESGLEKFCVPIEISPYELKKHIDECRVSGLLDGRLDDRERAQIMEKLGWILGDGKGNRQVWKLRNT